MSHFPSDTHDGSRADQPLALKSNLGLGLPARWVVVCETVLDIGLGDDVLTGGRPELGYALIANAGTFATEDEARQAHRSAGLPLGWVIMPLSRLLPDLYEQA